MSAPCTKDRNQVWRKRLGTAGVWIMTAFICLCYLLTPNVLEWPPKRQ